MLTELCQELRNWFDRDQPKWYGEFTIEDGALVLRDDMSLKLGQHFRIVGSALNDGVYQYGQDELADEAFTGSIWAMAVPPSVIALSAEIGEWVVKYESLSNENMSPFQSESFGGYTYSKAGAGSSGGGIVSWQDAFRNKLNRWRKI